jgi:triacylglycerol lipase
LINWTNRLKRLAADLTLMKQNFNAVAFYLGIADMLAEEGL